MSNAEFEIENNLSCKTDESRRLIDIFGKLSLADKRCFVRQCRFMILLFVQKGKMKTVAGINITFGWERSV